MKLLIITDDKVGQRPDGRLTAQLATTRLRLLVAYHAARSAGFTAWLAVRHKPADLIGSDAFRDADTVLFGKTFEDHSATALAAKQAGKRVLVDIADGLGSTGDFDELGRVAACADAVFCSSARLTEMAAAWVPADCRRFCIEEPAEEAIRAPKAQLGGDGILELLWFGTSRNIVYLVPHLSEIAALAEDRPFRITLVCHENVVAQQLCAAAAEQDQGLFKIRFEEWTPQVQAAALDATDIVLIPGDLAKDSAQKSPNRLINTIAAGRLAVASPIPSYLPFADFALIRDCLADGIRDALAMPAADLEARIGAGQRVVAERYSAAEIGRHWIAAFQALGSERP
ncbi:hypothetical protein T8K17_17965 [Thalassobaculum sp. OXR-137]|uniref:hypothetical protein n=1 Tax=Thalassobaculum sp. OXR-137 TaxID=3100173 RepID=UPI002AC8C268|nr:hypothetical protein [Thalassobaculum sp. OXR-137]WPZ33118.1 hypothetical protein T8K17_17965 [Thalassobaculum sp. OXR-137]